MRALLRAIRRRLNERSTYMMITAAVGAAALLPWPWSVVSCVVGSVAAFIPDGPVKKDSEQ